MNSIHYQPDLIVIGGGLAGCEAALQASEAGLRVDLYEMRPEVSTGAHVTDYLAELVCSNSLGSNLPDRAPGLLKQEMRLLRSKLLACAEASAVPAGAALAVDRIEFSRRVTDIVENQPGLRLIRQEMTALPDIPTVVASGPLTSSRLSASLASLTGQSHLYFYDAISPIVAYDSINFEIAYKASRFGDGDSDDGDYINCPMTRAEYEQFIDALVGADRIELKEFERDLEGGVKTGLHEYFEGCLPIEVLARRGRDALAYGPMRPIGLIDPRTGRRPYAVVQLRQDNVAGSLYNIVGFQTNLTFPEQRRVFRAIPGMETAEFERYGQMHRNTFIFSPDLLHPTLQFKDRPNLFFAGQITGVEGYAGNIATGLLAGLNAARYLKNKELLVMPRTSMLGALCHYITHASAKDFQPMKANFGLLPEIEFSGRKKPGRKERGQLYANRALVDLEAYLQTIT